MIVRCRLFAVLRERAGTEGVELDLPDGAAASDALAELQELTAGCRWCMAVNREYADAATTVLAAGDELALIPPVSGGSVARPTCGSPSAAGARPRWSRASRDPRAGAVVTFCGVTREVPPWSTRPTREMAEAQMAQIVAAAIETHGLCAAAAEHRVGTVPLSEASVVVAVSAPHRGEAFAGAREIIDQIKARRRSGSRRRASG